MKAFVVYTPVLKPSQSSLFYSPDTSDSETKGTWIAISDGYTAKNCAWNDSFALFLTGLLVEWSDE